MEIVQKHLGIEPYEVTWEAMRKFTLHRTPATPDEIWSVQHPSVYTQGQSGKPEHILHQSKIPIIQSDRGGQVTYHDLGQIVLYVLLDLKRRNLGIKHLVCLLENTVIALLSDYGLKAQSKTGAPGVYIADEKICSLGLRVKRGSTYHGLALNVDMDLTPFDHINPCGFDGLRMTQLKTYLLDLDFSAIEQKLMDQLVINLQNVTS